MTARGRPRDPDADEALLTAALGLLATKGFQELTMEDVAQVAGVAKTTLYRRYASKAELIATALNRGLDLRTVRLSGDTRRDLRLLLERVQQDLTEGPAMQIIATLLQEQQRHPELLEVFRKSVIRPRRRFLREVLVERQARGDIRGDADVEVIVDALVGSIHAHLIHSGAPPKDWAARAVAEVWAGAAVKT